MKVWLQRLLDHPRTERFILAVILFNAVTLGLETDKTVQTHFGAWLYWLDLAALTIFCIELALRLYVRGWRFFCDAWNVFDFVVVAIALIPASGPLTVLRALRILRVLRLITVVPSLKRVVGALLAALPGMGSIVLLLGLIFYVAAVIATKLFGEAFPQWFGTLVDSVYSLFQIMTLDSWSSGTLRPMMEVFPYAWLFFIPFILISTFTALNLFIGVVVSAMQTELEASRQPARPGGEQKVANEHQEEDQAQLLAEVRALRAELGQLTRELQQRQPDQDLSGPGSAGMGRTDKKEMVSG